ncbi:MAG: type I glutamate--ammonia ligase, partial [Clostridia bacterium]|nr:type I glutamate--ammonia ligase [Clostridia bacterium]
RLICDVYNTDGTPFVGDPRGVLKRVLKKVEAMGYSAFNVGPECEFFLFQTDEEGKPTTKTNDEAGYFDLGPLDHGERTRRHICMALESMGFEIEASHHENAAGQHEIDFKYADALRAADNIMTFKLAVKQMAQHDGLHATFMPKPIFGVAGSGMHTNMSLFKNGKNVFDDPSGEKGLSKEAYSFIAGILAHVRGMAAVTNPLVNSYKRLVPGYEAPCYMAWSASNRSALVRIPATRGMGTRVELRSPDPSCNPYLSLAVCLAAGLDGIEKGMTPPAEITENIFAMDQESRRAHHIENLPGSLDEAIRCLEEDRLILDALGPHVANNYLDGKRKEWDEYRTRVSSWEREKYIINY